MEIQFVWIIVIISFTVVSIIFSYFQTKEHKTRICNDLLMHKDARDIVITSIWGDMDKSTRTYRVEYTDKQGMRCRTRCKIQTGLLSDDEVYWRDPL